MLSVKDCQTLFLAFLDQKTKKLDFLDLKITVLGYIFPKNFWTNSILPHFS